MMFVLPETGGERRREREVASYHRCTKTPRQCVSIGQLKNDIQQLHLVSDIIALCMHLIS